MAHHDDGLQPKNDKNKKIKTAVAIICLILIITGFIVGKIFFNLEHSSIYTTVFTLILSISTNIAIASKGRFCLKICRFGVIANIITQLLLAFISIPCIAGWIAKDGRYCSGGVAGLVLFSVCIIEQSTLCFAIAMAIKDIDSRKETRNSSTQQEQTVVFLPMAASNPKPPSCFNF